VETKLEVFWWKRWELRACGKNKETGEPRYQMEFVPVSGTRPEFLAEFQSVFERWLPHIQLVRILSQTKKKQQELLVLSKDVKVGTSVSDYAAQLETQREHTATCATREKHNCCVTVIGYKPRSVELNLKKHGKRTVDKTVLVVKQQVDVFYGLFSAAHKPSAEHYNMQRLDAEHFLKFRTTLYGEWFINGVRIPKADGTKHAAELPSGNMPGPNGDEDGDPWTLKDVEDCQEWAAGSADFPTMTDHLEITDGSGNQFQGETNLGRVVTSLVGPTAVRRHSVIGVPAHGKGMGDALGFVIKVNVDEGVRCRRLLLQGTTPSRRGTRAPRRACGSLSATFTASTTIACGPRRRSTSALLPPKPFIRAPQR